MLVNYLMALAFQASALMMPQTNDLLIVLKPCVNEEIMKTTVNFPIKLIDQKLEDNC